MPYKKIPEVHRILDELRAAGHSFGDKTGVRLMVNGYEFEFEHHPKRGGRISNPVDAPLNNPEFLQARELCDELLDYSRLCSIIMHTKKLNGNRKRPRLDLTPLILDCYSVIKQQSLFFLRQETEEYIQWVKQTPQLAVSNEIIEHTPAAGYVYLLKSSTGYYKIGRTKNPTNRLTTFEVKLPFEVEFECVIATDSMVALEKELHALFAANRVNGEWFNLDAEQVAFIKSLAEAVR